ncbi:hypothetical protein CLHUN_25370 [Ruminiclostridium hungatei]|uniref:Uncharacterized protein n=1 Tax=Ruminiclostridium hungatei TaxID=48256 RepID=A0A1V4SI84_RUMHU|nr:hypothetical protein [Ruminiclostridium hungatei]OPX43599.1 hypothetical protein CLHUN_25370 [Ruminiclostridium hungatei]
MPKPIFKTDQGNNLQLNLSVHSTTKAKLDPMLQERRLRQKRSSNYINTIKKLDIAGHNLDRSQFDNFINAIKQEFPDVPFEGHLIGIVAQCHLGTPYDVHTLDIAGEIVTHFKLSESMPPLLERARGLALYGGYEFIEVYVDSLRAVKADGTVSVTK